MGFWHYYNKIDLPPTNVTRILTEILIPGCMINFNSLTVFYEGKLSDLEKRAVELEHTTKQFNSNAKQVKINAQKHFWEGNELKILVGAILFCGVNRIFEIMFHWFFTGVVCAIIIIVLIVIIASL